MDFAQIVLCAADSVAQLRRFDVYRTVDEAEELGCATAFVEWLSAQRPDLAVEAAECLAETPPAASRTL